jgi:hypothetical protein
VRDIPGDLHCLARLLLHLRKKVGRVGRLSDVQAKWGTKCIGFYYAAGGKCYLDPFVHKVIELGVTKAAVSRWRKIVLGAEPQLPPHRFVVRLRLVGLRDLHGP